MIAIIIMSLTSACAYAKKGKDTNPVIVPATTAPITTADGFDAPLDYGEPSDVTFVRTERVPYFKNTTISPGFVTIQVDRISPVPPAVDYSVLQTVIAVQPSEGFSYDIKQGSAVDGTIHVKFDNSLGCKKNYYLKRKAGLYDASNGGFPSCRME